MTRDHDLKVGLKSTNALIVIVIRTVDSPNLILSNLVPKNCQPQLGQIRECLLY